MNIVRELRIRNGIQQKELALELGVSCAAVSNWEHGKSDPSGERLKKLSEIFGVDELIILGSASVFPISTDKSKPISETEQIVQQILERLQSQSPEIRIVSGAMEKMSKEQQDQVVAVVRAMFANHPELFN